MAENENKKTWIVGGIVAVLCLIALVVALPHSSQNISSLGQVFYSDDDGATWFRDDAGKITPFDHNGKQAVRAYVFQCGSKQFVGRLERMTPEKQHFEQALADATKAGTAPPPTPHGGGPFDWGIEAKRPGPGPWVSSANLRQFAPLLQAVCPDGGGAPQPVLP